MRTTQEPNAAHEMGLLIEEVSALVDKVEKLIRGTGVDLVLRKEPRNIFPEVIVEWVDSEYEFKLKGNYFMCKDAWQRRLLRMCC